MTYDVEVRATTTAIIRVEAADADQAAERALDEVYDEVHEVDRSTWRAVCTARID